MSTWHYVKDSQKLGPIEAPELQKLISSGTLPLNVLIWQEGMANWIPANTIAEFTSTTPPIPSSGVPPIPSTTGSDAADAEKNKVFGILAYIFFPIPLLAARESKFARYHTNQALVLFLAYMCSIVVGGVILGLMVLLPFIGFSFFIFGEVVLSFGYIYLFVLGIINAANKECKPLPLIGHYVLIKQ